MPLSPNSFDVESRLTRFTHIAMLPTDQPSPPAAPAPSTPAVPLPRIAPPPRSTSRDRWAEQAHPDSGASLSRETCVFRPQKRPEEININQNNPPVRRSNPSHRTNSDGNNRFFTKLFSRVHKANYINRKTRFSRLSRFSRLCNRARLQSCR